MAILQAAVQCKVSKTAPEVLSGWTVAPATDMHEGFKGYAHKQHCMACTSCAMWMHMHHIYGYDIAGIADLLELCC